MVQFLSLEENDIMWNLVNYGTRPKTARAFVPTPPLGILKTKFGRF